jgi:putative two-component system response regulator
MLQMAHEIALFHHERWEGGGYPEDLKGEDIPVAARIVALVDVYDALSQDRVYRKACPAAEVLKNMRESRGSHFDPHLFDLFLDSIPDFERIAAENP